MSALSDYFLRNSKVVLLISLALVLGGILSALDMRREAFPNVNFATAKITAYYPGATPEDMELRVTKKIEEEIRGIDGLKEVRSISQEGYMKIDVRVDIDRPDSKDILDEIQRAVDQVSDLPDDLPDPPRFEELKTKNMPILEVSLVGDVDEITLREYADHLEDLIEMHPGVYDANKIGYRDREFRVYVDPDKMREQHVSFDEIANAIRARNISMPGGVFESRPNEMSVRTVEDFEEADELLDVVVRTNLSGQVVRIRDLAEVKDTFEKPRVITKTNGRPSIILVISKKENADIMDLTRDLKDDLDRFEQDLPEGMEIVISNDESARTAERLDIIVNNSIIGFVLLLGALIVFINVRNALVTSLAVPFVILATLLVMSHMGITFNLISMMAIVVALGMFVDNSIVISENIFRHHHAGLPMEEAASVGVKEIAAPITATVLTTVAAFLPMLVTTGVMGQFIWSIPVVVSISLFASLGDSIFLLPSRIIALDHEGDVEEKGWFVWLRDKFAAMLDTMLRFRWVTLFMATAALFGSLAFAVMKLDFILFPPEGVDLFIVRYEATPGTPIEDLHKAIGRVEKKILKLPAKELKAITTRTGVQQVGMNDPLEKTGDNVGMIMVYLTRENQRDRIADEIITQLRNEMPLKPPFTRLTFERVVNGPPVGKPVTLTVMGNDLEELKEITADIRGYLATINGVQDIDQDLKPGLRQLRIDVKDNVTADYGLTVLDIASAVRTAHEGQIASTVRKFEEDIDIRLLYPEGDRGSREELEKLVIADRRGNLIPLSQVADIVEEPGPEPRKHFDFRRSITVTAEVDNEVITSMAANAKVREEYGDFDKRFPGYTLKYGGEEESTAESMASLSRAMIFAIIGIFSILVALFGSFLTPFLIMFSIPFGFIGVIIGFAVHDKPLGFLAMIGIIGLAGVVVNSSIVLISFIESLRKSEKLSRHDALIKASAMRLRPIMLTTLTTVSALLPTAYGLGGWDPILVPMTLAMAWGLLFGTGLTLIVIPCGYAALEDIFFLLRKIKERALNRA